MATGKISCWIHMEADMLENEDGGIRDVGRQDQEHWTGNH